MSTLTDLRANRDRDRRHRGQQATRLVAAFVTDGLPGLTAEQEQQAIEAKRRAEHVLARQWSRRTGRCWCMSPYEKIPGDHIDGCEYLASVTDDDEIPF